MEFRDVGLGVYEVFSKRLYDTRGFFAVTLERDSFKKKGIETEWVQENHSLSTSSYVLRGLHLQVGSLAQAKLVRVLSGSVFDVAVDVRRQSATFGKWVSCVLSEDRSNQIYIPEGFAHGFLTMEPQVEVLYKVSAPYSSEAERTIAWNDPELGIEWPLHGRAPILSSKDAAAPSFAAFSASVENK